MKNFKTYLEMVTHRRDVLKKGGKILGFDLTDSVIHRTNKVIDIHGVYFYTCINNDFECCFYYTATGRDEK